MSYTAADRGWAEWISWQLEDAGYTVFLQAWDMVPGVNWLRMMNQATRFAERTIAVLTVRYLTDSAFGEVEWLAAYRRDPSGLAGRVIPVRVEDCAPDGLLAGIVYADLVGVDDKRAATETLLQAVRAAVARRSKPLVEPDFPGAVVPRAATAPSAPSSHSRPGRNTASATGDRTVAGSAMVHGDPPDRRRIIMEATDLLERSDNIRDPNVRMMLLNELEVALGVPLRLREVSLLRPHLVQLVTACMDHTGGLRSLADCLGLFESGTARVDALLRLADEWQAMEQFAWHDLGWLRTDLLRMRLTADLRTFVAEQCGEPIPVYCESAWHAFAHLASLPPAQDAPAWLRLLERLATDVPPRSRPQLNDLIRDLAGEWGV